MYQYPANNFGQNYPGSVYNGQIRPERQDSYSIKGASENSRHRLSSGSIVFTNNTVPFERYAPEGKTVVTIAGPVEILDVPYLEVRY